MRAGEQLSLFDLARTASPNWDDVQKGRAVVVTHDAYTTPCSPKCMWADSIGDFGGRERCCYLFRKPVLDGMCPSTCKLEWI